jgi:hypothetical protein
VLRIPLAKISSPEPSGRMRMMLAKRGSSSRQLLQGAPTGTYNIPSGPKRMTFQPWRVLPGKESLTTAGAGASSSRLSMSSKRMTRFTSAT